MNTVADLRASSPAIAEALDLAILAAVEAGHEKIVIRALDASQDEARAWTRSRFVLAMMDEGPSSKPLAGALYQLADAMGCAEELEGYWSLAGSRETELRAFVQGSAT